MQKTKIIVAVLGALSALPVLAADAPAPAFTPSANVSIVSNYLYRGISQTGANPALQGGFDLAHASGAYIGVWGSSISWISDAGSASNAGTEFDTYLGYKGTVGAIGYDVGYLRYNYPGTYGTSSIKADTDEIYGALTYSFLTAKYSYSLGDTFGTAKAEGTYYAELNASYTVGETGYSLGAHYGSQQYQGVNKGSLSYSDYKLSVSKDFSGYVVGLAYSGTNADEAAYTVLTKNLGKSATVLSLSRAF
jgi:uncharacterized protein (TIGR02001 family)